jgi:hypothetical protein
MIAGFDVGTRVKWNENNAFVTGVVQRVIREPGPIDVDNRPMDIQVTDGSPAYVVAKDNGETYLISHRDLMLDNVNEHTGIEGDSRDHTP